MGKKKGVVADDSNEAIKRLVRGFVTDGGSGSTLYIIPRLDPIVDDDADTVMDVVVVEISETRKSSGKKLYEGYQGKVTLQGLEDLTATELPAHALKEKLQKAVNNEDGYSARLSSHGENSYLEFVQNENPTTLARSRLHSVDLVVPAGRLVEALLINFQNTSEEYLKLKSQFESSEHQLSNTRTHLKELTMEKTTSADKLIRAFTKAMNAQKYGYSKLQKEYDDLKKRLDDMTDSDVIMKSQSQTLLDENTAEDDDAVLTDYEMETDIEDDDDAPAMKKQRLVPQREPSLSSDEDGGKRHKQELRTPTKTTKKNNKLAAIFDDSETDMNDSSQEIVIPKAKRPTAYRSPFKTSEGSEDSRSPTKNAPADTNPNSMKSVSLYSPRKTRSKEALLSGVFDSQ